MQYVKYIWYIYIFHIYVLLIYKCTTCISLGFHRLKLVSAGAGAGVGGVSTAGNKPGWRLDQRGVGPPDQIPFVSMLCVPPLPLSLCICTPSPPPHPTLHLAAVYLPDLSYCLVCHLQSLAVRAALTDRGISCLCLVLRAGLSRWIGKLCTNATGKHVMTHTGTLPPTAAAPHGATVRLCIFVYPRGRPVNSMQDNITCRL